jgi:two-component system nitrate/nitrite response regulator NarL
MMMVVQIGDQPLWQDAMGDVLRGRFGQVESVAAPSAQAALGLIEQHSPALVLADFCVEDMCETPGLEAVVRSAHSAPVVTLDARQTPSRVRRALAAGAKGYIPKTATRALIDAAVGLVVAGGLYFPQLGPDGDQADATNAWRGRLSRRQRQVLDLVMQGKTNREIAEALSICLPTVKLHVRGLLKIAGVRNRTEAALLGLERAPSLGHAAVRPDHDDFGPDRSKIVKRDRF